MTKILIVVDMQNDFVTGSLGTEEAMKIIPNVVTRIKQCINKGYRIFYTKDTHDNNYLGTYEGECIPVKHCIKDTEGWRIINEILETDPIVHLREVWKDTFGVTDWYHLLSPYISKWSSNCTIELIGVCTDICVVSNALIIRSSFPDVQISVIENCCAGTTPERHKAALDVMRSCNIDVNTMSKGNAK